ncbi:MAG: hypothetical protein PHT88_02875 [Candidatus Moranbacteria bacterium]|nr:hypothetical protein [Candidatus Moranbacteria bacterium]
MSNALPDGMRHIIDELKQSASQEECLKKAYVILTKKYHGERIRTYRNLFDIFKRDLDTLWNKSGFLHCTNINYLLRTLLVQSAFFTEDDIRLKWTLVWYVSPHQYLQVLVGSEWINVDIWAHAYGIGFGDNACGFH